MYISLLLRTRIAAYSCISFIFNMKTIAVLCAFLTVSVFAAPAEEKEVVLVKSSPVDNIGIDGYNFGYELSNGQTHEESAQVVNAGQENQHLVVRGSFAFVDPATNVKYSVNYVADDNGFHPEGAHLPTV